MDRNAERRKRRPNLVLWLISLPLWLVVAVFVLLPLGILTLLSFPYYAVFPDRHFHYYDVDDATPRQRELTAKWRAKYRALGITGRIKRALQKHRRWRRVTNHRVPAVVRRMRASFRKSNERT